MRINLRQTKSMKRYLVYTTDVLRPPPFDQTRLSKPHTPKIAMQARQLVAVGARVTPRPPHGSVRAPLCIRLLPRVPDGETLVGPGMKDSRLWEPVVRQLRHSSPGETAFLTASAECPAPAFGDLGSKGSQRIPVGWDCVVVEEAGDDLLQPFTLFGYRLMHPPSQLPRNLLDLRLHAVATGPPLEEEFAPSRLAADKGHTEEVEGLRFAEPALLAVGRRVAPKLNQAGLFRM